MKTDLKIYKKELDVIYNDYIKPVHTGKESVYPDWSVPQTERQDNYPPPITKPPALERCSEGVLRNICLKQSMMYFETAGGNANYSTRQEPTSSPAERHWLTYYLNCESKYKWFSNCERSKFKPLIDKMKKTTGKQLAFIGNPKFYMKWKNLDGFMGWHTNHDQSPKFKEEPKLDRTYFVYNRSEGSFFRYLDPKTEEVVTIEEPVGWSIVDFKLKIKAPYFWHCVYTPDIRFSIGVRELYDAEVKTWTEINYPI